MPKSPLSRENENAAPNSLPPRAVERLPQKASQVRLHVRLQVPPPASVTVLPLLSKVVVRPHWLVRAYPKKDLVEATTWSSLPTHVRPVPRCALSLFLLALLTRALMPRKAQVALKAVPSFELGARLLLLRVPLLLLSRLEVLAPVH